MTDFGLPHMHSQCLSASDAGYYSGVKMIGEQNDNESFIMDQNER